jgi:hypothetical protein
MHTFNVIRYQFDGVYTAVYIHTVSVYVLYVQMISDLPHSGLEYICSMYVLIIIII